jgi:hypothetical protein
MNIELFNRLALETGGSHYPKVGGKLLNQFGDLVVAECLQILDNRAENWRNDDIALEARRCASAIREHFGVI